MYFKLLTDISYYYQKRKFVFKIYTVLATIYMILLPPSYPKLIYLFSISVCKYEMRKVVTVYSPIIKFLSNESGIIATILV